MATAQGAPVLEPRVPAVAESPVLAHRQVRIDTRHVRLAYPWSAVTLRYVMGNEPQRLSPGSAQAAVTHVRMIGLSLFFTVLVLTWVSCGGRDGKVVETARWPRSSCPPPSRRTPHSMSTEIDPGKVP